MDSEVEQKMGTIVIKRVTEKHKRSSTIIIFRKPFLFMDENGMGMVCVYVVVMVVVGRHHFYVYHLIQPSKR